MPKLNIDTRWIPQHQTVYVGTIPVRWIKHILQIRATFTPAPATTPMLSFSNTSKTMYWKLNIHTTWDITDGPKPFDNASLTVPVDGIWHTIGTAPNEEALVAYAEAYCPTGRTSLEDFIYAKGYTMANVDIRTGFSGTGSCTVEGTPYSANFSCTLTSTVKVEYTAPQLTIESYVASTYQAV